jgi:hypothetical protein
MRENSITTIEEAKEYVLDNEDPIDILINPSNLIHQDIKSWDNVDIDRLRDELAGGMGDSWTYGINHPYGDLIESIAIERFIEDIPDVRFKHLVFDNIRDCVKNGYRPYGSELGNENPNREDMRQIVYEVKDNIDYFHEYEDEVRYEIESYIMDARLKNLE